VTVRNGTVALALPKARRRRRKPPGPAFWWAFAWVVWDIGWAVFDVIAPPVHPMDVFCAAVMVAFLTWWPNHWAWFRRELRRWLEDE
jgi:hypothetical protein